MNKVEFLSPDVVSGRRPVAAHELRSPPKAARMLLCVWGYSYVRQFLEYSLPTLLAPGNIPALAAALPTEFVILTSADDESFIVEHPTFKRLDLHLQNENPSDRSSYLRRQLLHHHYARLCRSGA